MLLTSAGNRWADVTSVQALKLLLPICLPLRSQCSLCLGTTKDLLTMVDLSALAYWELLTIICKSKSYLYLHINWSCRMR